jgi:integrase
MARLKVALKNSNGSIQLVYTWQGKRRYLSIGLEWTKANCEIARLTAARIEMDMLKDRFVDPDSYKVGGGKQQPSAPAAIDRSISLVNLWAEYQEYKKPKLAQSTIGGPVRNHTAAITRSPYGLDQPVQLRNWVESNLAITNATRVWQALNACCRWAVENGRLSSNPLAGLSIAQPKARSKEVDPFTAEERDRILEVIAAGKYSRHYYRLISFLFFTGCRPSEAIALEWQHIARDRQSLTFCQAATLNEAGQLRTKQGLKSQQRRKIPLNSKVVEILGESNGESPLVFPALGGGLINTRNLAVRIWKPALAEAGINFRNLYQMRHTAITLMLQAGVPIPDIARIVGNSPKVILEHYAGVSRNLELPEI